jgi:hypothetical protein
MFKVKVRGKLPLTLLLIIQAYQVMRSPYDMYV